MNTYIPCKIILKGTLRYLEIYGNAKKELTRNSLYTLGTITNTKLLPNKKEQFNMVVACTNDGTFSATIYIEVTGEVKYQPFFSQSIYYTSKCKCIY